MTAPTPPNLMRDEYDGLPEPIRMLYSYTEYLWLSDAERARLIQAECEPDQYDA